MTDKHTCEKISPHRGKTRDGEGSDKEGREGGKDTHTFTCTIILGSFNTTSYYM